VVLKRLRTTTVEDGFRFIEFESPLFVPHRGQFRGLITFSSAKSQVVERLVVGWSDVYRLNKRGAATTLINMSDRIWEERLSII